MNIAVITGASSGMGREFVRHIDRAFDLDEIWVIARREDRLRSLQSECRTAVRPIPLDLLDEASFAAYRALLETHRPAVKLLVNAAGFGLFGTFAEMDLDTQLQSIRLNANALTALCHITIPYLPEGSAIVNLASNSSWQPVPYINVYGASKAYVMSFSRALGMELRAKKIHVMAVAPGWIKTEFFDRAVRDDTIKYYDRFYTAEQVVQKAMRDLRRRKTVSILGLPVRLQVFAVKFLPTALVMKTWCRQQGK
ncbi:MAG: SDR family NAD(P)-dependent oxidoreductase [Oscillospiraceae bacterium]|nr:SDR family NAD(P)-dependent oxidoreductase [Oscillospiraceae bacterium]